MSCSSYVSSSDISVVEEGTEKKPPAGENMIVVEETQEGGPRAWFTLAGV